MQPNQQEKSHWVSGFRGFRKTTFFFYWKGQQEYVSLNRFPSALELKRMRRESREFKRHQEGHFTSQEGTSFVKSQIERKKCIENSDFLPQIESSFY